MTGGRSCVFCGSTGTLTREHVFGNWLSRLGLGDEAVERLAGPLNQIGTSMGKSLPFQTTVKNVCADCNNGWMGKLEEVARRVLTPLVLGQPGRIERADQGAIAAWAQKTALMAMYLSSAADREAGHGVGPSEYTALYKQRQRQEPLANSLFWVGRNTESFHLGAAWVTPLAVNVEGLPEPEFPHGYSMTIAVGELLLHGIRFTDLPFYIDVATERPFDQIWPAESAVDWPASVELTDEVLLGLAQGREFVLADKELRLRPMSAVMDSPPSEVVGTTVEMPTPCRENHLVYCPMMLAESGMRGVFHWFYTECECDVAYLVHTEIDGAHVRFEGEPESMAVQYEAIPGTEYVFRDENGEFAYKREASE